MRRWGAHRQISEGLRKHGHMNRHCRVEAVGAGILWPSGDGWNAPEKRLPIAGRRVGLSGTFFCLTHSTRGNAAKSINEPVVA